MEKVGPLIQYVWSIIRRKLWTQTCTQGEHHLEIKEEISNASLNQSLPDGSDGEESALKVGDLALTPGSGRSSGEGMATHSSILA